MDGVMKTDVASDGAASATTVPEDSLDAVFKPVEDGLARLAGSFEQAFPIWLEIGRAANEAAIRVRRLNADRPRGQKIKVVEELETRFPRSATEIARARRLATVVTKKTPGAYPLPPAATQFPKAMVWASDEGQRPPSCLREADDLLRTYNRVHIPEYQNWLCARERRTAQRRTPPREAADAIYRRRWRRVAERAAVLDALLDRALQALAAAGGDADALLSERDEGRSAWLYDLATEPLVAHATIVALVPEAEAALWAAQDAVAQAEPANLLERQRDIGAAIESHANRIFPDFETADRLPWAAHVLGCTTDKARLFVRLHQRWDAVQQALDRGDDTTRRRAAINLEDALALVEVPQKQPGHRSDYFGGYAKRHRVSAKSGSGA